MAHEFPLVTHQFWHAILLLLNNTSLFFVSIMIVHITCVFTWCTVHYSVAPVSVVLCRYSL